MIALPWWAALLLGLGTVVIGIAFAVLMCWAITVLGERE